MRLEEHHPVADAAVRDGLRRPHYYKLKTHISSRDNSRATRTQSIDKSRSSTRNGNRIRTPFLDTTAGCSLNQSLHKLHPYNQSLHKLRLKKEVDKVVSLLRREVGSDFLENTRLVIAFCVRGASFRLAYKQHFVVGSGGEVTGWESSHAHSESV